MYTHTHTHTHTHTRTRNNKILRLDDLGVVFGTHQYWDILQQIYIYTHARTHIHAHINIHNSKDISPRRPVGGIRYASTSRNTQNIFTCNIYLHVHTHTHTYTHTHTHTHTHNIMIKNVRLGNLGALFGTHQRWGAPKQIYKYIHTYTFKKKRTPRRSGGGILGAST